MPAAATQSGDQGAGQCVAILAAANSDFLSTLAR